MRTIVLAIHIAAGSVGLLVGAAAMAVPKRPAHRGVQRWHRLLGVTYQVAVAALCLSAVGLTLFHPAVWWLAVIAAGTEAAAIGGYLSRPTRRPEQVARHVGLMCGSYVSFVTAFLVVNLSALAWWFLPTLIGTPLIAWASARGARRYLPRHPAGPVAAASRVPYA